MGAGPGVMHFGWSEIAQNPGAPRPMLCLRLMAPVDPDRYGRVLAAGVGGLVAKVKPAAAGLPSVVAVQGLRRDLTAANARSREAQGRRHAAREERAAILAAPESTPDNAARFPVVELDIARAEHQFIEAERAAGIIAQKIPAAIKVGDHTLRAFARSAADVRFRELTKEFLATVRQLDGVIVERILTLWMAASSTRDAGDLVYTQVRDLLGNELPAENNEIQQDAPHVIATRQDAAHADAVEFERINALPDHRPRARAETSHYYDRSTGRYIAMLAEGQRIPDMPLAESRVPQARRESLYARCVNSAAYGDALRVLTDLARLQDMYASSTDIKELLRLFAVQDEQLRKLEEQLNAELEGTSTDNSRQSRAPEEGGGTSPATPAG